MCFLSVGETRGRVVTLERARVTFRWAAVLTRCDAYGDDRPRPEVVFYGNAPMGEGEIFLDKGQPAFPPLECIVSWGLWRKRTPASGLSLSGECPGLGRRT